MILLRDVLPAAVLELAERIRINHVRSDSCSQFQQSRTSTAQTDYGMLFPASFWNRTTPCFSAPHKLNAPVDSSRHFFQQPAKALHGLSYVQPFFDRPHPRGHRV